jgi:hypothetical protein
MMALWLMGLGCCLGVEWVRHLAESGQAIPTSLHWAVDFLFDTPMFLPLFLLWPLCYWITTGLVLHRVDLVRSWTTAWARWCLPPAAGRVGSVSAVDSYPEPPTSRVDWGLSTLIGALSLFMSWQVGRPLENLPPAYHDEYSYLFQAQTLLTGRFSYPSNPTVAPIFDQLHVVNQGQFASRYYPGTGAWLASWVAIGHPVWGQWLAGALMAFLIFWTVRELSSSGVAFLAGILIALSPGLALFSNLLLAHHPTLLGLSLFLHGFTKWLIRGRSVSLLEAGCGLSFAMLCRPATAAGVALPFGIWFAKWLLSQQVDLPDASSVKVGAKQKFFAALMLGLPLIAGWAIMIAYNHSITHNWLKSPYQLYTDVYTPRHVFGFNNVTRGAAAQGDHVLSAVTRNYDAWAEELTPTLAVHNVGQRLIGSLRWSLGIIPLVWIILAAWGVPLASGSDKKRHLGWNLIAASIVSLHLIHVPYWFDGIMHWHYVFESCILWLMLAARGAGALVVRFQAANRPWLIVWVGCLLITSVMSNYISLSPYWETRQAMGIAELRYPRRIYREFRRRIAKEVTDLPALVLVIPDPSDRHMDFVTNEPSLTSPILVGRLIPEEISLEQIKREYPDRTLYLYDAKTKELKKTRTEPSP